jgi:signal transduction histidine kinase
MKPALPWKSRWKLGLTLAAVGVVLGTMAYIQWLSGQLAREEQVRIRLFAELVHAVSLLPPDEQNYDFTILSQVMEENTTIPLVLTDRFGFILAARNCGRPLQTSADTLWYRTEIERMKAERTPVEIRDFYNGSQFLYYRSSWILELLTFFPYLQLASIVLLVWVGYWAFHQARRAEQQQVWVGMAKETAHQLGTPISGLVAWVENLKAMEPDNENVQLVMREFSRDVEHLQLVADRFSKIGAEPKLTPHDLREVLRRNLDYIRPRAARKIVFEFDEPTAPVHALLNPLLFEWVVENLLKNALDAMGPEGTVRLSLSTERRSILLDVSDTGKGIPRNKFSAVFRPGFTTKKRGWGLGLSLAKRIVQDYHGGKIFVKESTPGKGTTFRIQLPEATAEG